MSTGFPITSTECPPIKVRNLLIFSNRPSPLFAEMELTVMFTAFCRSNRYFLTLASLDPEKELVDDEVQDSIS